LARGIWLRTAARRRGAAHVAGAVAGLVTVGGGVAAPAGAFPLDPPTGGAPAVVERVPPVAPDAYGAPAPRVDQIDCRMGCGAAGVARAGALVRIAGERMRGVAEAVFLAGPGEEDDTSAAPARTGLRAALVRVPREAASGPVALVLADGTRSAPSEAVLVVDPNAPLPAPGEIDAEVQGRTVFYDAARPAELSFVLGGATPAGVVVELVRDHDGAVVETWVRADVTPGIPQTVTWDGTAGGRVQRDGEYRFRVRAVGPATPPAPAAPDASAGGATAATATAASTDAGDGTQSPAAGEPLDAAASAGVVVAESDGERGAFTFLRHRFPIAGAHEYGVGGGVFGGGRGHQGQDVFAECGTPVVAARGGTVAFEQFEGNAGHYVVIDGAGTEVDYAYMHLRDAALVDVDDRVRTGRLIGFVGNTGRADGCHLHFEMWSEPGWYDGGAPFDPLPQLRAWDARS
jgi:murein DD-endopeptidase MepM/ murein hydrolase activator NlpD